MSEKTYILAIDQGTTSTRAIIYNHAGEAIANSQKEITQFFPNDGWVEHNPNEIWNSAQSVIADAFIQSNLKPAQIAAIGITNQRETTVVWNKHTGQPVYPAIVWQSRQSAAIAEQLKAQNLATFFKKKLA